MKTDIHDLVIDISDLNDKDFLHEFILGNEYLSLLEQELIEEGDFNIKLKLTKTTGMIKVDFDITGKIKLICDRSLKDFLYDIDRKSHIYFKYSDRNEEVSEEIVLIKEDTTKIDFAVYIFENIALSIPAKKIHPDFKRDNEEESDENILVYSSIDNTNELTDSDIDILDPRWEALKKLKDTL